MKLLLISSFFIYLFIILYEYYKLNNKLASKYFRYGVILFSSLSVAFYVAILDTEKLILEREKEINKFVLLHTSNIKDDFIKKSIESLNNTNQKFRKTMNNLTIAYQQLVIIGLGVLVLIMRFEKRKIIKSNQKT